MVNDSSVTVKLNFAVKEHMGNHYKAKFYLFQQDSSLAFGYIQKLKWNKGWRFIDTIRLSWSHASGHRFQESEV